MNHLPTIRHDLAFLFMTVVVESVIFKKNQTAGWIEMSLDVKF